MYWNKAKTCIIAALCLTNLFLFVCNALYSSNKYHLTPRRAADIKTVLQNNNISMDCPINLPFPPMRGLAVQLSSEYSHEALRDIFIKNPSQADFNIEDNRFVYRTDWESLTIASDGYVLYRNRDVKAASPDPAEARRVCSDFLKRLGVPDFREDLSYSSSDGLTFEFRQKYGKFVVNSNFLIISVGDTGVSRVEFMYAAPVGFTGQKREICAPDEALMSCMYELQNIYGYSPVSIERVELVYMQTEKGSAQPFYRVFKKDDYTPMLINAYENTVYSG
ncbi:MAG: hypothetical protein LBU36_03295 [Clostridiales bacterium]|nr:hypothetical protein [Clostridiales bacterium]